MPLVKLKTIKEILEMYPDAGFNVSGWLCTGAHVITWQGAQA
jgi:hypothetical protein